MKYSVRKSVEIQASEEIVLKKIGDLTQWQTWSPWACLDPNTQIASTHDTMSWNSSFTGSGNMTILSHTSEQINIDLNFIKPFKSHADVTFTIVKVSENTTIVTWQMSSKLPFFMCFFKKFFEVMIGRDFDRGLTRLKALCETGCVPVKLEFIDTPEIIAGFKIAGISSTCSMKEIATSMHSAFKKLHILTNEAKINSTMAACFCYNVKLTKEVMDYTAAAIYDGSDVKLGELISQNIPEHKFIKVVIHGSYDFMGDAWAGVYTHLRGLKLKMDKKVHPYEVYIKGPHNTNNPNEYITEVRFPVK